MGSVKLQSSCEVEAGGIKAGTHRQFSLMPGRRERFADVSRIAPGNLLFSAFAATNETQQAAQKWHYSSSSRHPPTSYKSSLMSPVQR